MNATFPLTQFRNVSPRQAGSTLTGVILGLLAGLMVALGVAMYVTKAPMPFSTKTASPSEKPLPMPNEGQAPPDPNTLLLPKEAREFIQAPNIQAATPGSAAAPGPAAGQSATPGSGTAPASAGAPAAGAAPAVLFFLETGRFKSADDAEQMRVRLMLASVEANVVEVVTDSGSPFRVRVGPYGSAEDAYRARTRITENGFEARLVKVSR